MNYPTYDQQTVVIDEGGLARPVDVTDELAALDVADIRAARDDATHEFHADVAEHDLRIALLSLLAAAKDYRGRGIPEFADAADGLRAQTAFLINTIHG
ncbi:MAG TPA: hypothetical protein VGL02_24250 [Streptomyces sp.]